jgi:hypothetical protein
MASTSCGLFKSIACLAMACFIAPNGFALTMLAEA